MTAVKVDGRLLVDWQATIRTHLPMVGRYVPDAMPAMREMLGVLESAVWGDLPIDVGDQIAHTDRDRYIHDTCTGGKP